MPTVQAKRSNNVTPLSSAASDASGWTAKKGNLSRAKSSENMQTVQAKRSEKSGTLLEGYARGQQGP